MQLSAPRSEAVVCYLAYGELRSIRGPGYDSVPIPPDVGLPYSDEGKKMDKGNQIFGVILIAAFLYACYSFSRVSGTADNHPGNQRPVNRPPVVVVTPR